MSRVRAFVSFLMVLMLVLSGCSKRKQTKPTRRQLHAKFALGEKRRAKAKDDIAEVVFRRMFASNYSIRKAKYYYLSVDGNDPNERLMSRFHSNKPKVLQASKFTRAVRNSEESLRFTVGEISFYKGKYAVVSGSCYEGPLSAAFYSFVLKRHKGRWIIKSRRLTMWS